MANKRNEEKRKQRERNRAKRNAPGSFLPPSRIEHPNFEPVRIEGINQTRDWYDRPPTAMEMSDILERKALRPYGRKLRAAYYPMIGDAPILGPADHDGATDYLVKISKAIARGGWTRSEWTRLSQLHKKWWKRANGQDPYFEVYGNRRQWADHGTTYQKAEDKKVVDAVNEIKKVVWDAVQDQLKRTPKKELPSETRARHEQIEAARLRLTADERRKGD